MNYLLREGLPVRGAIAYGTYYRSRTPKGVVIAGSAFIDAYHFEKSQNWVGIAICPSVLRKWPDFAEKCELPALYFREDALEDMAWVMTVQPCPEIPWHRETGDTKGVLEGFAVVPLSPGVTYREMPQQLNLVTAQLKKQQLLAGSPSAQSKYDTPIRWLTNLSERWNGVIHASRSIRTDKSA